MGEFRGFGGHVLANEGDCEELAVERRVGSLDEGALEVVGLQQPKVHAADAREAVRQRRREPRVAQVKHLPKLGAELVEGVGRGPTRQVARYNVVGELRSVEREALAGRHPLSAHEEYEPAGKRRLEVLVVELLGEQHEVRCRVELLRSHAAPHGRRQVGEDRRRARVGVGGVDADRERRVLARRGTGGGDTVGGGTGGGGTGGGGTGGGGTIGVANAAARVKEGIEQVPRDAPAEAGLQIGLGHIERLLVAQRPVELTLERMEHEIDLVEEQHRAAEDGVHVHTSLRLPSQPWELVVVVVGLGAAEGAAGRLPRPAQPKGRLEAAAQRGAALLLLEAAAREELEALEQLEDEALERRGRADDDRLGLTRVAQLVVLLRRVRRARVAVVREGVHGLDDDSRKRGAHHGARHLEQRGGHALHDAAIAVGEEQREHRRDHLSSRAGGVGEIDGDAARYGEMCGGMWGDISCSPSSCRRP